MAYGEQRMRGGAACDPVPRRRAGEYIWLVYSVFYFVEPVVRHSRVYWAECLAIFAAFLAVYVLYVETRRPWLRPWLVGVIGLFGLGLLHFNQGASFFLIFAAALLPFCVDSMKLALWMIMAGSAAVALEWVVLRENAVNYAITFGFMYVVGLANLFVAERIRARLRLQEAQAENAALAAVAERERIARDLHDVLGHTLSVIVLKAELARRLMERDPERAAAEIADVERTARTALAEVRETIGGYRELGLAAELSLARRALDAAGVRLTLEEAVAGRVRGEAQTVLSLTLREAVTNIVRHAGATECRVRLATGEGVHSLVIEDDGTHGVAREGNGLRGMRERVERLGGRFALEVEGGTRVRVEVPVVG